MPSLQSLEEAAAYFSDHRNCFDFMVRRRWPDGVICPVCGSKDVAFLSARELFQCKTQHPRRQFSVKAGTVMEGSPIPLERWLIAEWMVEHEPGISSYRISRTIGITQKSAWLMLKRFRDVPTAAQGEPSEPS